MGFTSDRSSKVAFPQESLVATPIRTIDSNRSTTPFGGKATGRVGRTWGFYCFARYALAEVVIAKHKGPEVESLGPLCVCERAGYFAAGTANAAFAALAALFFSRLTLAQRFC